MTDKANMETTDPGGEKEYPQTSMVHGDMNTTPNGHPPPGLTTMESMPREKIRGGAKAKAQGFFDELLPKGTCIWSDFSPPDGKKWGVFMAPGKFHTNETESGMDMAVWCCEIQRSKTGKVSRKPTIVNDPKKGKRVFYQHFIIEWDIVVEFGKKLLELMGVPGMGIGDDAMVRGKEEIERDALKKKADELTDRMRRLGMVR